MRLEKNERYHAGTLVFAGWYNPENEDTHSYNAHDYFGGNGQYLGPDAFGIEPEFEDTTLYVIVASIDNVIQDSAEYLGEYRGVKFGTIDTAEDAAEELRGWADEYYLPPDTIYEVTEA